MAKAYDTSPGITPPDQTGAPGEYEVGYGRPPLASRFQPGRSGRSQLSISQARMASRLVWLPSMTTRSGRPSGSVRPTVGGALFLSWSQIRNRTRDACDAQEARLG